MPMSTGLLGRSSGPTNQWRPNRPLGFRPKFQICRELRHIASVCYHKSNLSYTLPPWPNFNGISAPTTTYTQSGYLPDHVLTSSHASKSPQASSWFLDSGASNHFTHDGFLLSQAVHYPGSEQISVANGMTIPIDSVCHSSIPTPSGRFLSLPFTLHSSSLSHNLLSGFCICEDNSVYVSFFPSHFTIKDLSSQSQSLRPQPSKHLSQIHLSGTIDSAILLKHL